MRLKGMEKKWRDFGPLAMWDMSVVLVLFFNFADFLQIELSRRTSE